MITFKDHEIKAMQKHPDILRILADWHSLQETMADAIGPEFEGCCTYHSNRYKELREEARRLDIEYDTN